MVRGEKLTGSLRAFIEGQQMFFVATAAPTGTVNMSPKGADSLRILDDTRLLWLNLSGSGNETAGHLRQLNRMTMMFCAFEGNALILRLYGSANVLHPRDAGWDEAAAQFPPMAGSRQIFEFNMDYWQTSCGTGVPIMPFEKDRADVEMIPHFDKLGEDGVEAFWRKKNTVTNDGFDTGLFED